MADKPVATTWSLLGELKPTAINCTMNDIDLQNLKDALLGGGTAYSVLKGDLDAMLSGKTSKLKDVLMGKTYGKSKIQEVLTALGPQASMDAIEKMLAQPSVKEQLKQEQKKPSVYSYHTLDFPTIKSALNCTTNEPGLDYDEAVASLSSLASVIKAVAQKKADGQEQPYKDHSEFIKALKESVVSGVTSFKPLSSYMHYPGTTMMVKDTTLPGKVSITPKGTFVGVDFGQDSDMASHSVVGTEYPMTYTHTLVQKLLNRMDEQEALHTNLEKVVARLEEDLEIKDKLIKELQGNVSWELASIPSSEKRLKALEKQVKDIEYTQKNLMLTYQHGVLSAVVKLQEQTKQLTQVFEGWTKPAIKHLQTQTGVAPEFPISPSVKQGYPTSEQESQALDINPFVYSTASEIVMVKDDIQLLKNKLGQFADNLTDLYDQFNTLSFQQGDVMGQMKGNVSPALEKLVKVMEIHDQKLKAIESPQGAVGGMFKEVAELQHTVSMLQATIAKLSQTSLTQVISSQDHTELMNLKLKVDGLIPPVCQLVNAFNQKLAADKQVVQNQYGIPLPPV